MNSDANRPMPYYDDDGEIRFNVNLDPRAATADRKARFTWPPVGFNDVHTQPPVVACRDIYADDGTSITPTDTSTRNDSVPNRAEARGVAQLGQLWAVSRASATPPIIQDDGPPIFPQYHGLL